MVVLAPLVVALRAGEKPRFGLVGGADLFHFIAGAIVAALGASHRRRRADLGVVDLGHVDRAAVGVLALGRDHVRLAVGVARLLEATGATDPQPIVAVHHRAALVAEFHVVESGTRGI